MDFYEQLVKPSWAPRAPVFGVVWSVLYPIIFLAYGFAIVQILRGRWPSWLLAPILINLAANLAHPFSSACGTCGLPRSTSSSCS